ncbi:MAG: hypothetical protein LC687_04615 [Actinobacteria bacterium]|nr:hypothetical protein [Actinomycetota bacterium]
MSTPEGKVKDFAKRRLKKEFGDDLWDYMPPGGMFGKAGTPDYIGLWSGVFFGIEFKADETKKPTKLQYKALNQIKRAGGVAAVLAGKDKAKMDAIIKAIRDRANGTNSST